MKGSFYIYLLAVLSVLVSCTRKTQTANSRNDSVEKYLKLASIDTLPLEIRKKYNNKAFSFIDLERNDTVVRWYLGEVSRNYLKNHYFNEYSIISKIYFEKSEMAKDTLNLARFFRTKSRFFSEKKNQSDSAFYYICKSEKLFLKTLNHKGLIKAYLNKGQIQLDFNDFLGAELSYKKANKIANDKDLIYQKFEVSNGLGNIYSNIGKYELAIQSHKKAYYIAKKLNKEYSNFEDHYEGTSLNNIGNCYREINDYKTALYYFEKVFKDHESLKKDKVLKAFLLNNIGYCYLKTNQLNKLPIIFIEAATIFDKCGKKNEAAISRVYLAEYYSKIRDTITAIKYCEDALQIAKESKSNYYYLYVLSNAGAINREKAPNYIAEYHRLNDSLLFEERKARSQYFKIQLETDEITKEREKAIQQKWIQTSTITGLLIIVILLFIIYRQRSQKKEFILVQNQQKANEEIYQLMLNQQAKEEDARQNEKKRIARELHDNVMNQLASTRFNLFSLTQDSNTKLAKEHIDKIKAVEDEIRNLTHELASERFDNENSFTQLIQKLVDQQNQLHPTDFTLKMDFNIDWDNIPSEIKMNLYRIIQEAVHNCNKHSNATEVEVKFTKQNGQLDLTITDNGIGFDILKENQGIGLRNMYQRMESIAGKASINSKLGKGTVIHCFVLV